MLARNQKYLVADTKRKLLEDYNPEELQCLQY